MTAASPILVAIVALSGQLDPLAPCRALLDERKPQEAAACFDDVAAVLPAPADGALDEHAETRRTARALAQLAAAWAASASATPDALPGRSSLPAVEAATNPDGTPTDGREEPEEDRLDSALASGRAEGVVHGALLGSAGGFLVASAVLSTTRTETGASVPWLVGAPVAGGLAGVAGAAALLRLDPTPGDVALVTSTTWVGGAGAGLLQLAIFDGDPHVSSIPLRFWTTLGGGAVGLGAGLALAPLLDVTPGDVGVMNSAALWGGTIGALGIAAAATDTTIDVAPLALAVDGAVLLPYAAALALHDFYELDRASTWLIEGGGAAGFLLSGAVAIAAQPTQKVALATLACGTALGVTGGALAAVVVDAALDQPGGTLRMIGDAPVSLVPSIDVDARGRATPVVAFGGRLP